MAFNNTKLEVLIKQNAHTSKSLVTHLIISVQDKCSEEANILHIKAHIHESSILKKSEKHEMHFALSPH